LFVKWWWWLWQ